VNSRAIYKYCSNPFSDEVIKVADLPLAAVVRIAKKSGAERVGSDAAAALVAQSEEYIASLVKKANTFAMHAGRKTIKEEDVELAAKEV
jgi:histone H3/H4